MSNNSMRPAAFDRRTTDHQEIAEWVDSYDGAPVAIQDDLDAEVDVKFDDIDDPVARPIDWPTFFKRFETAELVFAYQTDPVDDPKSACALFERARIEESNRLGEHQEEGETDRLDLDEEVGNVGDGHSSVRHEQATDQENADNHRDEEPFNS